MANYDTMIKDGRDALLQKIKVCDDSIDINSAFLKPLIGVAPLNAIMPIYYFATGNEYMGAISSVYCAILPLWLAITGILYGRAKNQKAALTEELKGLEAKLQ